MSVNWRSATGALVLLATLAAGCGNYEGPANQDPAVADAEEISGSIEVDGSSTVAPLTDAVAEEYANEAPKVGVSVGVSGTGGGFERFCAGETDISNASRAIKDEEVALCEEAGVEFIELKIGTDALTMVTNPATEFVTCLTTEQVTAIFGPDAPVDTWKDVSGEFPDEPIAVFAPGQDSGTYDFMVEDVLGLETSREDYSAAEDDNIIAQGIIGTQGAWGFFGFAYYQQNAEQLRALQYDGGEGCVAPSVETAQDGSYKMTRPLFIYVKKDSLGRTAVSDFVTYYLDNVGSLIDEIGYIAVTDDELATAKSTLDAELGS